MRVLKSGETLTVDCGIDLDLDAVSESHDGVSVTRIGSGNTTTGTVTIAGPNAPQAVRLQLAAAANTVDRWVSGVRTADFRLTGVSGVDGAGPSGVTSAKVFVNDSRIERTTYLRAKPIASRTVEEGSTVTVQLHGKAGRRGSGPRPWDWYNVTVGVQNLTTGFDDLGRGYRGHDTIGGFLRRDEAKGIDYYNVGVLGYGRFGELVIPILDDGVGEGDERFRVFIAETPDKGYARQASYMGVRGTYNSLQAAPGVDFTIEGRSDGGRRSSEDRIEPPPGPTRAVSNVRVAAVDAATPR